LFRGTFLLALYDSHNKQRLFPKQQQQTVSRNRCAVFTAQKFDVYYVDGRNASLIPQTAGTPECQLRVAYQQNFNIPGHRHWKKKIDYKSAELPVEVH
jgi:hypothetical protein